MCLKSGGRSVRISDKFGVWRSRFKTSTVQLDLSKNSPIYWIMDSLQEITKKSNQLFRSRFLKDIYFIVAKWESKNRKINDNS